MCVATIPMQHEALRINSTTVEEEFNVTVNNSEAADIQRFCRIVTYYYIVEAIDNDSNIYYYLKQNALDALAYWVSFTGYNLSSYNILGLFLGFSSSRFFDVVGKQKLKPRKACD